MSTAVQDVCCSPAVNGGAVVSDVDRAAAVDEVLALYTNDVGYGVEKLVTEMEHACQAAKIVSHACTSSQKGVGWWGR